MLCRLGLESRGLKRQVDMGELRALEEPLFHGTPVVVSFSATSVVVPLPKNFVNEFVRLGWAGRPSVGKIEVEALKD